MLRFDIAFTSLLLSGRFLAGQAVNPSDADFRLYSGTDLVVLSVSVQDHRGGNVKGLNSQDFRIYEDDKLQTVKQFSGEDRPVTLGIVVDASGSMRTKQAEVATAALAFVQASNPQDEVFVVNFNDRASLGLPPNVPFTNVATQLSSALLGRVPEGRTALYDALTLAARHLAQGKWENKALLLISDGGDNNSLQSLSDALRAVQESGATVYSVGLFDPAEPEHNLGALHRLSKLSGGESFLPDTLSEIAPLCLRIARDIRATYTIAYTPPSPEQHTAARKLKVIANYARAGKLTIRTRSSYILPQR